MKRDERPLSDASPELNSPGASSGNDWSLGTACSTGGVLDREDRSQCNRREALLAGSIGLGGVLAGSAFASASAQTREKEPTSRIVPLAEDDGLPRGWRELRKIDVHNHVLDDVHQPNANWMRVESMVKTAERLGIVKLCCSKPITGGRMASIDEVRSANDAVLAAMKRFPEIISGFCFVQPGNGQAGLDEIVRCVEGGMIGVKLYNQFKYTEPIVFPVAEKCIELGIPMLGHSAHLTDRKTREAQPKTSDSLDFCQLAGRYPELKLILGHINGGGDWEWAIKALRDCPSVYVDTSGSVLENDTIETCVRELGIRRILFATDQTMEGCVGKVLSARLTMEEREIIFSRNADRLFNRKK